MRVFGAMHGEAPQPTRRWLGPAELQASARLLVDQMALALQAATLLTHGHPAAAEAFCASRLPSAGRLGGAVNYGALLARDLAAGGPADDFAGAAAERVLIERLTPA